MMKIVLIILALIYLLWPYDLFPDLFLGWGWLDDAVILGLLWKYILLPELKRYRRQTHYENNQGASRSHYGGEFSEQETPHSDGRFIDPTASKDPYKVLGVAQGASPVEIKKAYRELANKYHPDKVIHLGEEFKELADKRFKEIQASYEKLMSGTFSTQ